MKKNSNAASWISPLIVLVLIVQTVAISYLLIKTHTIKQENSNFEKRLTSLSGTALNASMLQTPVVLPKENVIAIPELGIVLPYNDITKHLRYYSHDNNDFRVTSTVLQDLKIRQITCTELVRINTESPEPYSPWEEKAGSITLANGKTIHIISARAFANNEASTMDCATEVWGLVTPQLVADEFKKAQSL